MKIRRICIYGAPGTGKSTIAAFIYATLKENHYNVEMVREHVKTWAYLNKKPESFDQVYLFAEQLHAEDVLLRAGVDYVISDCPILFAYFYSYLQKMPGWTCLAAIAREFDKKYAQIGIYLGLPDHYEEFGRFQTLEEAQEIDRSMLNMLKGQIAADRLKYFDSAFLDRDKILDLVFSSLEIK